MAKSPNVYDTTYVNSGPGVALSNRSSSSSSGSSSGSSGTSPGVGYVQPRTQEQMAREYANAIKTSPSVLAEKIREEIHNPGTSAMAASSYNDFMSQYGLGFDMDEYFDKILEVNEANNDWSASQAKKQMDYQTMSDQAAMAWSAQEALKSREWTERLSNSAHQREVQDLIKAGLNPILSANNGAYSGSGATGQGFSSAGAMGQTDMSGATSIASMMSGVIGTARDLAVTKLTTDTQKYMSDQSYAAAKLAAGASIYNNNNTVSANKAMSALNRDADIQKANISADATRAAAGTSAGAMMSAAATNAAAARYSAEKHAEAAMYGSDLSSAASRYGSENALEGTKYGVDRNIKTNPVGYAATVAQEAAKVMSNVSNVYTPDLGEWNLLGSE